MFTFFLPTKKVACHFAASFIRCHRSSCAHFRHRPALSPRPWFSIGTKNNETWSTSRPTKNPVPCQSQEKHFFPLKADTSLLHYHELSKIQLKTIPNVVTQRLIEGKSPYTSSLPRAHQKKPQTSAGKASCWTIKELEANSQHIR